MHIAYVLWREVNQKKSQELAIDWPHCYFALVESNDHVYSNNEVISYKISQYIYIFYIVIILKTCISVCG
jgi:hypothetical protein